jgi:hypothetical protein
MLRPTRLIALVALGIAADAASAAAQAPPGSMYGSDALANATKDAIANAVAASAVGAGSIVYKGTGATQGIKAMNLGDTGAVPAIPRENQQIGVSSRFLTDTECGSAISSGPGQGMVIGLDAIGIMRSSLGTTPATNCNTLRYANDGGDGVALDGGFTFDDWRDVVRVVYAGVFPGAKPSLNATDSCLEKAPARSAVAPSAGRCDHPSRIALVKNWRKLFQETTCAAGNCPTGLRHAFRRDDAAATTDVFLTLLALPAVTPAANRPFCNGLEAEDNDPIRTVCDNNENVCAAIPFANRAAPSDPAAQGGDLGLVVAVTMPTDTTKQYSTLACGLGRFSFAAMPTAIAPINQKCPDGNSRVGNLCRAPQSNTAKFGCNAVKGSVPPNRVFVNMDGRAYNLTPRDPDTGALLIQPTGVTDPRWGGGGWYKIHQSTVMSNAGTGAVTCKTDNPSRQMGCLVQADPCTISYESRQGLSWAGTIAASNNVALNLRTPANETNAPISGGPSGQKGANNAADTAAIRRLELAQGGTAPACATDFGERYPLARTLWILASKGFGQTPNGVKNFPNIDNAGSTVSMVKDEGKLLDWIVAHKTDAGTGWDALLTKYDFVPSTNFKVYQCASPTSAGVPLALVNTLP